MGWHLLTQSFPSAQGGNTIRQLLKIAKKTVPEEEWSRTPVVLKATAGLRLLPEDKARALLKEVRRRRFSDFVTQTVWRKRSEMEKPQQPLLTSVCGKIKIIWASLVAAEIRDGKKKQNCCFVEETVFITLKHGLINSCDEVLDLSHQSVLKHNWLM